MKQLRKDPRLDELANYHKLYGSGGPGDDGPGGDKAGDSSGDGGFWEWIAGWWWNWH